MSIVALKRKSHRFLAPISNGQVFSLNGGYRNQRPICNTNLAQLRQATALCSGNNPAIIKRSTLNTKGYVYEHLWYPVCQNGTDVCSPQNNWVKNMSLENLTRSQGVFIDNLVHSQGSALGPDGLPCNPLIKAEIPGPTAAGSCTAAKRYRIGGKLICPNVYAKNGIGAVSSSDYQRTGLMQQQCLPTPAYAQPFPPVLLHDGCDGATVLTPAEAIRQSILPQNWTGIA